MLVSNRVQRNRNKCGLKVAFLIFLAGVESIDSCMVMDTVTAHEVAETEKYH